MWRIGMCGFALLLSKCFANKLIVETANGKVQGTSFSSPDGTIFYTWRHIPYAKPPVGKLRFLAPESPDPWANILDGTQDSPACFFVGSFAGDPVPTNGFSEDCLYVNVYSSEPANASDNRSVMFWIYGGGLYAGAADFSFYDPTPFLEENVIVVTFNYRLNVFGFLSTEDKLVPGNSGLKDQLMALKWTKQNIAYFGGNPLDITIFGESSGALSVGYHIISEQSRGLFVGAIMESGSALIDYFQTNGKRNAITVAKQFNSSITESSSSQEVLDVLQTVNAESLVNVSFAVQRNNSHAYRLFKPIIEYDHSTAFINKPQYEQLEAGLFFRVPAIIGINSEEYLSNFANESDVEETARRFDSNYTLLVPNMNLRDDVDLNAAALEIKEAYAGSGKFQDNLSSIVKYSSDNEFGRSSLKHAVLQSQYSPVYFYQFSFVGTRSINRVKIPGCGRVAHGDEVPYLFNISTKLIETKADFLTRKKVVKLWTNFAKTRNATPKDDSAELLQNVTWEPFDAESLQYLDIGDQLEIKYHLKANKIAFWNYFWQTVSYHPYNTF